MTVKCALLIVFRMQQVMVDWVEQRMAKAEMDVEVLALGALVQSIAALKGVAVTPPKIDKVANMNFDEKFDFTMELLYSNNLIPRSLAPTEFKDSTVKFIHAIRVLLTHQLSTDITQTPMKTLAFRANKSGLHQDMAVFNWKPVQKALKDRISLMEVDCDHWTILKGDHAKAVGAAVDKFLHSS